MTTYAAAPERGASGTRTASAARFTPVRAAATRTAVAVCARLISVEPVAMSPGAEPARGAVGTRTASATGLIATTVSAARPTTGQLWPRARPRS